MLPQKWPQWTIIPIGFLLVVAIIGAGLGLVAAVQAAAPGAEASPNPASSYEASLKNPDLLGYVHAQEGLECLDCHTWQAEQVDAEAVAEGSTAKRMTKMDACFNCHVDNEHTSYDQVIGRTTDYVIDGQTINPHDPHPGTGVPQLGCGECHKMHEESQPVKGCYSCHHEGTIENCGACHEPSFYRTY